MLVRYVNVFKLFFLFKMNTLKKFRSSYKKLADIWGYRTEADPNYEDLTEGDLRQFQHLTDFIMRYLSEGYYYENDVKTMYGVDFYKEGSEFNVTDKVFHKYLKLCGPYFLKNRDTISNAYDYLTECPKSVDCTLLKISLKWMKIVLLYFEIYKSGKKCSIKKFTRMIKAAAIKICKSNSNTVQDAIERVYHSASNKIVSIKKYLLRKEFCKIVDKYKSSV